MNFIANTRDVNEINESDFIKNGKRKNFYEVTARTCLRQPKSGPCGWYSMYHLSKLKNGGSLLKRNLFESTFDYSKRYCDTSSSRAMKEFIESGNVKGLYSRNVMIVCSKMNDLNYFDNKKVITFGRYNSIKERIKDFQKNGNTQYLIVSTSSKSSINGINLHWDDKNNRRSCMGNHWIAIRIAWQDRSKPGKCSVCMDVADSGSVKDNRYAALIHWYYYMFVSKYNYYA